MSFNIADLKQLSKDSYSVFSYLYIANTIKNKNDGHNPKTPYYFFFTKNKKIQIDDDTFKDNLLILLDRLYNSEQIDSYSIELAMKLMLNDLGLGKFDLYDDNMKRLKEDKIRGDTLFEMERGNKKSFNEIYNELLNHFNEDDFEIDTWTKCSSNYIINYFHSIVCNLRLSFIQEMEKSIKISNGLILYPGVIKIVSLYNVLLKTGYELMNNFRVDEYQYQDFIRIILKDPDYDLKGKSLYRFEFNKLRKQEQYQNSCNNLINPDSFYFSDDDLKYQIDGYIIQIFGQSLDKKLVVEIGKALNIYPSNMNENYLIDMEEAENELHEENEKLYQMMDEFENKIETDIKKLREKLEKSTDPVEKAKITENIKKLEVHLNSIENISDEYITENDDSVDDKNFNASAEDLAALGSGDLAARDLAARDLAARDLAARDLAAPAGDLADSDNNEYICEEIVDSSDEDEYSDDSSNESEYSDYYSDEDEYSDDSSDEFNIEYVD